MNFNQTEYISGRRRVESNFSSSFLHSPVFNDKMPIIFSLESKNKIF